MNTKSFKALKLTLKPCAHAGSFHWSSGFTVHRSSLRKGGGQKGKQNAGGGVSRVEGLSRVAFIKAVE